MSRAALRAARRAGVGLAGSGLLGIGLILLIAPGPGIPVLILGLVVLATEFPWAARFLEMARGRIAAYRHKPTPVADRPNGTAAGAIPSPGRSSLAA